MRFSAAMRALEQGERVRATCWEKSQFIDISMKNHQIGRIGLAVHAEWELFQEPQKLLSFSEIVKGLKEGKRFTRKEWEKEQIPECPNNHSIHLAPSGWIVNCNGHPLNYCIEDLEATDWIAVKE